MKQIVSIGLGQAGIGVADACWEAFRLDHNLLQDGSFPETTNSNVIQRSFFTETGSSRVVPRTLFVDTDTRTLSNVQQGERREFYNPASFMPVLPLSEQFDTTRRVLERLRHFTEDCNHLEGFMVYSSIQGQVGSELMSRLIEQLSVYYPRKLKLGVALFPSFTKSEKLSAASVYGSVMALPLMLEHLSLTVLLQNSAISNICHRVLNSKSPGYHQMNQVIGQAIEGLTVSIRNNDNGYDSLKDIIDSAFTEHFRFATVSHAPLGSSSLPPENLTQIILQAFSRPNCLADCDHSQGLYIAGGLHFRGKIRSAEANSCFNTMRFNTKLYRKADWSARGMRWGFSARQPLCHPEFVRYHQALTVLANSTAIGHIFSELQHQVQMMEQKDFKKTLFEISGQQQTFEEAQNQLASLVADYHEAEQVDEEETGEEGEG